MRPMFVDGGPYEGTGGEPLEVLDPATGEPVDTVPGCGPADVDAAVTAAGDAFEGWWATPAARRGELLGQAADQHRPHGRAPSSSRRLRWHRVL